MILLVTYGLEQHNTHLLPWVYILKINTWLNKNGYESRILNLKASYLDASQGIISVDHLISSQRIECLVFPVDWRFKKLKLNINTDRVIYYFPGSYFSFVDYLKCLPHMSSRKAAQYGMNLAARLLFTKVTKRHFGDDCTFLFFSKFTETIFSRYVKCMQTVVMPPFFDNELLNFDQEMHSSKRSDYFLFMGSPMYERGFNDLLQLRDEIIRTKSKVKIKFLIRLDEHVNKVKLNQLLSRVQCENFIFETAKITRLQLYKEIKESMGVLLPFKIVPCEIPLAAYETYALGNFVITTGRNGLSELNKAIGINVDNSRSNNILKALEFVLENEPLADELRKKSHQYVENVGGWDQFLEHFEDIIKR